MKIKEILLIDDNDIDNFINKKIISMMNVADMITVKNSPIDALDYLQNKEDKFPELVFLDIKMPIMNGFGFLEEFSKFPDDKKENCAIVMLTSSYNNDDVEAAKDNVHVKEFLIKPLTNSKLAKVIDILF